MNENRDQEMPDDLIDTKEAASLCKCAVGSILRWIHTGKLAGWRRCGSYFVSKQSVLALFHPVTPDTVPQEAAPRVRTRRASNKEHEATRQILKAHGVL